MMTLSTMQEVVGTVNEQWESGLADQILRSWDQTAGSAKYWRASANFVFFFTRGKDDYVLRFNRAEERTETAIQAEIEFLIALSASGIPVANPVRAASGDYVESVSTAHGLFHAVVFEKIEGKPLDSDELTAKQFMRWGQALGELHSASSQITGPERPNWEEHLALVSEILPNNEEAALQVLDVVQRRLSQIPVTQQNFGLIHFDFELDNLVWNGEQWGIFDFDDCARWWFVADIAFALRDLFGDSARRVDLRNESFLQFIDGYRRARPINDNELKLIPLFIRTHNLITFAKLHRALTPINPRGEPTWLAELRGKLVTKMQTYRDEFVAANSHCL